jgi:hypothetical protein
VAEPTPAIIGASPIPIPTSPPPMTTPAPEPAPGPRSRATLPPRQRAAPARGASTPRPEVGIPATRD